MNDIVPIVAILSDKLIPLVAIVFGTLAPAWLIYQFFIKTRPARLNQKEILAMDQLSQQMRQMESRIVVLERILDTEVPAWRATMGAS
jgi:phage shock protein B